ncbi:unnamed protein product [Mytilus coruscus]|uniref:Uncharacterized protein n=1 Tax=Mytilus coruscus TaxID=42192 RepID=A0A6J8DDY8_MYTCO|nr:unnamed protein product [Mytilus coruscus]
MYQQLISHSNNPTPRFLGHWELPHYVQQNNESMEIHRYENILNGVVGMDSNFPFTTVSIEEALPMAFSISNYFICTFGDSTIAIFRLERSEQWFIFDSHSRNSTGITNPFGSAAIIELSNYEECVQFLRQNYEGKPFEITPVVFERQDVQSIDYSAPENNLIESMDVPIETNEENNNVKYITEPQGTHENPQDVQINNKKNIYINIDALNGDYKKYEQQIRLTGNNYCCCCEKILFEDQILKMPFISIKAIKWQSY